MIIPHIIGLICIIIILTGIVSNFILIKKYFKTSSIKSEIIRIILGAFMGLYILYTLIK